MRMSAWLPGFMTALALAIGSPAVAQTSAGVNSRSATDRKALVEELPNMKLTVNMVYPPRLPLGTVPARLLRVLPDLPPELEYRIVGRNLLLRDAKANIVVDFIRDVVPTIPG